MIRGARTVQDHAQQTDPFRRVVGNLVRRMLVSLVQAGARWQVTGFQSLKETFEAEIFQPIGVAARPPAGAQVEAVVLSVADGGDHQVIVALRDQATRAAVADAIGADVTALYNSAVGVYCDGGTIEARAHGGTAATLSKLEGLIALKNLIDGLELLPGDPGETLLAALKLAFGLWDPAGTTVLKGE